MSTASLLAEAVRLARAAGYQIREDHLDGAGGGHCWVRGRRWLMLEVTQSLDEQLSDAVDALRSEPRALPRDVSPQLAELLHVAQAA